MLGIWRHGGCGQDVIHFTTLQLRHYLLTLFWLKTSKLRLMQCAFLVTRLNEIDRWKIRIEQEMNEINVYSRTVGGIKFEGKKIIFPGP